MENKLLLQLLLLHLHLLLHTVQLLLPVVQLLLPIIQLLLPIKLLPLDVPLRKQLGLLDGLVEEVHTAHLICGPEILVDLQHGT